MNDKDLELFHVARMCGFFMHESWKRSQVM